MTGLQVSMQHMRSSSGRASLVCGWFRREEAAKTNVPAQCENAGAAKLCHAPTWSKTPSRFGVTMAVVFFLMLIQGLAATVVCARGDGTADARAVQPARFDA